MCMPWRHMGKWKCTVTHSEPWHSAQVSYQLPVSAALPLGKDNWYPPNSRLAEPHRQYGCNRDETNLLPLPRIKSQLLGCPAQSLDTICIMLSWSQWINSKLRNGNPMAVSEFTNFMKYLQVSTHNNKIIPELIWQMAYQLSQKKVNG